MKDKATILSKEYQLRFSKIADYRKKVWRILCQQYFSKFIPVNASILDMGAGWGEFINNIDAKTKYALDLNPDAALHLNNDILFLQQDCATPWRIETDSLDIIFTSNFLEHLPDKASVEFVIGEVFRTLKKGGKFICMGPNIKYVPGAYWDFWDHHIMLTELSASEIMKIVGFDIVKCIPRFLPYSMSRKRNPPLAAIQLYLKLPIIWPVFGKQFLVVAEKS